MKTKYDVPEITVLQLHTENVIVTSNFANGLTSQDNFDVNNSGNSDYGEWSDLFG